MNNISTSGQDYSKTGETPREQTLRQCSLSQSFVGTSLNFALLLHPAIAQTLLNRSGTALNIFI